MNRVLIDIDLLNVLKHAYLKEAFHFPDYYGMNLDALYDCLSDLDDTEVVIVNVDDTDEFSLGVLRVIDDVADDFGNLTVRFVYDEELTDD